MSKDIIVFTLHKSASMFIHRQCEYLSKLSCIAYNSPNIDNSGCDAKNLLSNPEVWRRHGCFAPVRFFTPIPRLEDYQIILHLRDPRDVLVSMFYSYCYIHNGEIAANTGYRKEVAELGIDDFVLNKATEKSANYKGDYGSGGHVEELIGNMPTRYRDYINNLLNLSNVTFLKYEQMVTDYEAWLKQFIQPFPLPDKEQSIAELVAQSQAFFPERNSDVMTHIRHVAPGDHKNKLKPATIKQLNVIFSDILQALNYTK